MLPLRIEVVEDYLQHSLQLGVALNGVGVRYADSFYIPQLTSFSPSSKLLGLCNIR